MRVYNEFYCYSTLVLIGDLSPDEFAKKLDEVAKQ